MGNIMFQTLWDFYGVCLMSFALVDKPRPQVTRITLNRRERMNAMALVPGQILKTPAVCAVLKIPICMRFIIG